MKVADFDFDLPESLIATHPVEPRDACKLLQVSKFFFDFEFHQLDDLLSAGDVLVLNDSKVIPARLFATRDGGDAVFEVLLHQHRAGQKGNVWSAFIKGAKRLNEGQVLRFGAGLEAKLLDKLESGEALLSFNQGDDVFYDALHEIGHMPLPPYIKRTDEAADAEAYQTIYAQDQGSVAAPTAGLHFTKPLLERILGAGVSIETVTLHVGAGTFQPVKVEDTKDHQMHSEWATISADTAERINAARAKGGKVVAVGTTSLRILETVADAQGNLTAFSGDTNIFITPGYQFKIVDRLITNFHLPKSTLFMLVSAFSGLERMKEVYEHAKQSGYRFYSYGDACLLDRVAK